MKTWYKKEPVPQYGWKISRWKPGVFGLGGHWAYVCITTESEVDGVLNHLKKGDSIIEVEVRHD